MKNSAVFVSFLLAVFSCAPKSNTTSMELNEKITLEKLDSVQINHLGKYQVHDLDPVSQTVVFVDHFDVSSEDILLAKFDGSIINSFSKLGDVPDGYGVLMSSIRLTGENQIMVFGGKGFITYDFDGNLIMRVKAIDFQPLNSKPFGMGLGIEKIGQRYLYVNQDLPDNRSFSDKEIYDEMYLLKWWSPTTGEQESFAQFPESSIYRSGKYFYPNSWAPAYSISDDKIYAAFGLEPVINVFDTNPPYSLLSSIPLDLPEYRYFEGRDKYSRDLNFFFLSVVTSGRILNIKKVDGYFLVAYIQGYSSADIEMRMAKKSEEETIDFNNRMDENYPVHLAILDSLGKLVNDIVPNGLEAQSMLIRNGELWMQETPDKEVEQDYFRLFRVGLKLD
ncbi:hypothetical protein [Algoriphagus aquimarinus]|uniref:6-bladed beta-propeller n=1 Tax=Algoriphagus aquimarinus TaxID=237018 RepID=A0A1I0YHL4_9BACT|nr:hypothetical protein [Algoriphagus aquimarinus]SFB12236.1 hypothetical protein SAMN04489723_104316 [Algoriphagus aquimarinus]